MNKFPPPPTGESSFRWTGLRTLNRSPPYAEYLSKGLQAPVELLRVVEHLPPEWMEWVVGVQPLQIAASMSSRAHDYLDEAAVSLRNKGLTVSSIVQDGDPAITIETEAVRVPDTLVAMSTHGRSGTTRWLMGSVTDRVLRTTAGPLLRVKGPQGESQEAAVKLRTVTVPPGRLRSGGTSPAPCGHAE